MADNEIMEKICAVCGGCPLRSMTENEYRKKKTENFAKTLSLIKNAAPSFDEPVFISDGCRRRADMAFALSGNVLKLGFNQAGTHNLIDVQTCPMLTAELNAFLPELRRFLQEFVRISITVKIKKKKMQTVSLHRGSVRLLQADNGIDVVLDLPVEPGLEHRLIVADFVNTTSGLLRLSWSIDGETPETIVEKQIPELYISGCTIAIPPGVFLQASKSAENAMIAAVTDYVGEIGGKAADLFCGLGTFTYPLAKGGTEVISADSSSSSLKGLQNALHRNQIHNVKTISRNLFKSPFDGEELNNVKVVVMDPPRAGAHEQCRAIASLPVRLRPEKVVFVSCNPKTFIYDADILVNAGYVFERVKLIDQFVYSGHQELVALFTFNSANNSANKINPEKTKE